MNEYIKKYKRNKKIVLLLRILIFIIFIFSWELLSKYNIINSFIFSSPSRILKMTISLYSSKDLFIHILETIKEVVISFSITTILGFIISIILYEFKILSDIIDPYLTMLNSLPKVALGPIIIIWMGANIKSIIFMSVIISIIVYIQNLITFFNNTDKNKIKLLKTYGANRYQILKNVIIPSNYINIISSLKINISMCLIGVIMGEFLTSKKGIGYLILYGSQVFNLDLVYLGITLLIILSIIMYEMIVRLEKNKNPH